MLMDIPLPFSYSQKVYVANSRQLKRIESISRSPIFSHFSETLSGADNIRAYSMTDEYVEINYVRLDANNAAAYAGMTAQRGLFQSHSDHLSLFISTRNGSRFDLYLFRLG
ncbi:hypothetical protein AHF37_07790 [Paragonimus kellicotti]|nr:hypothetical protein AHF37_07790 [Paragonimus kellicotti]